MQLLLAEKVAINFQQLIRSQRNKDKPALVIALKIIGIVLGARPKLSGVLVGKLLGECRDSVRVAEGIWVRVYHSLEKLFAAAAVIKHGLLAKSQIILTTLVAVLKH